MSRVLALYLALASRCEPAARLALRRRLRAGKEDSDRIGERLGHAALPRPAGPLVWFHAASVGEGLSLLPLIERLRAARPDVAVLVTSGTVTSARLLQARLPEGALHQFVPVDAGPAVARFLDHWRPDLAVWIESEIWPGLVTAVRRRGIPAFLLNARLSARSRARWRRLRGAASALFGAFQYVQAQDAATADALRDLGVPEERLCVAGSFKEAASPLPCDAAELSRLRADLGERVAWVAASTHPGEEEVVLRAHARLAAAVPGALLILAPRHPERGDDIARLLGSGDLSWQRRREGQPGGASVYLADTLGELGLWFRLARAAYVGGSFGDVGGHNPFEPIALDVPVLHGPDTGNFAATYRDLDAAGAAIRITSSDDLAEAVLRLLDAALASATAARARALVGTGSEALDRAVAALLAGLPPVEGLGTGSPRKS